MTSIQRTAVVTGAAAPRGIGKAAALRYAREGWAVVVLDLDEPAAKAAAEDIAAQTGATVFAHGIDVADEPSVQAAYDAVRAEVAAARLPAVGALANIAGITSPVPFLETTLDLWNKVLAVNATGTYLVTKAFLPDLIEAGWGRIVTMSSVSAQQGGGVFGKTPYCAAKAAILGFTKSLAKELGAAGITVNAVAPGAVDTDIRVGATTPELEDAITSGIPIGRQATVDDVAAVITWLSTDDAGYLQGTTIDINGGSFLH
ncbi:SDR family oxidoreductase [Saccharopolyspora shandongensis]|uniref:SDR family NAD(P)-dependent oxidoreductase n=1 Tax=Saccharopolyspora shandongensis TaxID=418495 RepID=UPI003444830F